MPQNEAYEIHLIIDLNAKYLNYYYIDDLNGCTSAKLRM